MIYKGSTGVHVSKEWCTLLSAVPQWVRAVEMGVTVCTLQVKTGTAVSERHRYQLQAETVVR